MAKRIALAKAVDDISQAVPPLIRLPERKARIDYDEEADVLYISLKRPQKATDMKREGNGRAGRLLAILMGLQAKLPPLDFTDIKGKKRLEYLRAVQAGLDRDYEPMERVFNDVWSVRPVGLLYERDLAGIYGELGWSWKSDFHAFYGSRRAHRRVKKFLPLLGVYQVRIGFDKRLTHLFQS